MEVLGTVDEVALKLIPAEECLNCVLSLYCMTVAADQITIIWRCLGCGKIFTFDVRSASMTKILST